MNTYTIVTRTAAIVATALALFGAFVALAWTGPASAPPNGNVSAPVNVGTTDQVKNSGLSVNALAVFGNSVMTGNVTAVGFFHSSDRNLKENIRTFPGLEIVHKLRGVSFTWKKDGTPSTGVIAQEVEEVMPQAVHTAADGTKSVDYDQLIAPLIEAVKAQQIEIDTLKAEIEKLR